MYAKPSMVKQIKQYELSCNRCKRSEVVTVSVDVKTNGSTPVVGWEWITDPRVDALLKKPFAPSINSMADAAELNRRAALVSLPKFLYCQICATAENEYRRVAREA